MQVEMQAISEHQHGDQWHSAALNGTRWHSVALSGTQWAQLRCKQWIMPVADDEGGHQHAMREAISGTHRACRR